jgi:hypothetical protein
MMIFGEFRLNHTGRAYRISSLRKPDIKVKDFCHPFKPSRNVAIFTTGDFHCLPDSKVRQ